MALPHHAFFRGRVVPYAEAKVGVLTHGLNYGTGVFGGIRGYWNARDEELYVFRPEEHMKRFLESTRLLLMNIPFSGAQLIEGVLELLRLEGYKEDCYVRPLAFYG